MTRLVHISDLHFGAQHQAALDALKIYLDQTQPDVVVISGDLTQSGRRSEFRSCRDWLAQLTVPYIATPGNHDTPLWNLAARLFRPFGLFSKYIGPARTSYWANQDVQIYTYNTARGMQWRMNWSKGAVHLGHLKRVLAHATVPTPKARILVCHHPVAEMKDAPMSAVVHRGAAAAQMIAAAGIDLLLCGHVHVPYVYPLPYGDGLSYLSVASTLSVRNRGALPGFNTIDIQPDAVRIVTMGFEGTAFSELNTWIQPRRRIDTERSSLP